MADLTADAPIRILGTAYTEKFFLETTAAHTAYKGQPLMVDQDVDATGPVVPYVDALSVGATDVCVGIATEGKTVAIASAETTEIEAYVGPTIVGFKSTVFTDGVDLGKTVYMSDSSTLSVTTTGNPQIGKLFRVKDGYAFVQLTTPQICASAA
jgi:hypothetical protein